MWKQERKQQVKIIKNICYYPPSLLHKSKVRSKRRNMTIEDPNQTIYQIFNSSVNNLNQTDYLNGNYNNVNEETLIN